MKERLNTSKTREVSTRQAAPFGADWQEQYQGTRNQAARKSRTEMPESTDGRMRCGRLKADPKVRQTITGAAPQRISNVKTPPSSAKGPLARNRAAGRKRMLISSVIRASGRYREQLGQIEKLRLEGKRIEPKLK